MGPRPPTAQMTTEPQATLNNPNKRVSLRFKAMGDSTFAAVSAFSSDESEGFVANCEMPTRKRQRKARQKSSGQVSPTPESLRALLGKPKCHCKNSCLQQFTGSCEFGELLQFRQQWSEMHKLDQDHEEAGPIQQVFVGREGTTKARSLMSETANRGIFWPR